MQEAQDPTWIPGQEARLHKPQLSVRMLHLRACMAKPRLRSHVTQLKPQIKNRFKKITLSASMRVFLEEFDI